MVRDESPAELPVGVPTTFRFTGAQVHNPRTGFVVELRGPVDFNLYATMPMTVTPPETGVPKEVEGITLLVVDPTAPGGERRLNVVSKRLIAALRPFLESGDYLKMPFTITKLSERPKSTFSLVPGGT